MIAVRSLPIRSLALIVFLASLASLGEGQAAQGGGHCDDHSRIQRGRWWGRMGSKSPYARLEGGEEEENREGEPRVDGGCESVMVVGLLRHGSRNPGKSDSRAFDALEDKLRAYGEEEFNKGYRWLHRWENPFKHTGIHGLVPQGMLEHYTIAKRVQKRFPHLFGAAGRGGYSAKEHVFVSSHLERASRSAASFAHGLFEGSGPPQMGGYLPVHVQTPKETERDTLLRFVDHCPRYEQIIEHQDGLRERNAFRDGPEVARAAARMSKLMFADGGGAGGASGGLTAQEAASLYTLCGFEMGHLNDTSRACSVLCSEDLEAFEYLDDLKHFYKKGAGHGVTRHMACPLLRHLLGVVRDNVEGNIKAGRGGIKSYLMFAHAETLVPLLTLLGLYVDGFKLTADTPLSVREKRAFRSSQITPMASNLLLVVYKCRTGRKGATYRVRALHNERTVALPVCQGSLDCPLETLLSEYASPSASCGFEAHCECRGPEGGAAVCGEGRGAEGSSEHGGNGRAGGKSALSMEGVLGELIGPQALAAAIACAALCFACVGGMAWLFLRA